MKFRTRIELEAPPVSHMIAGAICSIIGFFSLPFLLWRIGDGYYNEPAILVWFELAFHGLIFAMVFFLFREYLEESLLNMQLNMDQFITTVAIAVGLVLAVGIGWHFAYLFTGEQILSVAAFGVVPLTEMDVLVLGGAAAMHNPIVGIAYMVTLTPVITSCLYYAIGFTPFYNIHPLLGYLMVCVVTVFPRFCCAATWWVAEEQVMLYFAQLPVHLICCWAYRKMDTVWAPICVQIAANLIAGIVLTIVY